MRGAPSMLVLTVAAAACGGAPASKTEPAPTLRRDSVLGLMLSIDDALRRGSEPDLSALMIDLPTLRKRCPAVASEAFAAVEEARAEEPPSACVGLTDWSTLQRGVPLLPLSGGLNVDTKVCDEAWNDCVGVTRMCKSEIFYFVPQTPRAGFKVNLSSIVRVDGEYGLLRPPRCMAKGINAKPPAAADDPATR